MLVTLLFFVVVECYKHVVESFFVLQIVHSVRPTVDSKKHVTASEIKNTRISFLLCFDACFFV